MMLTRQQVDYLFGLLILLTTLAGVLTYPALPGQIAIHFSASGTSDNFVPRMVGVTLLLAIMLATLLFLRYTPTFDPTSNVTVLRVTTIATMALLWGVHVIVLAWNLDYPVNMNLVLPIVIGWALLLVEYALYKDGL